jgi:hypothetical protein
MQEMALNLLSAACYNCGVRSRSRPFLGHVFEIGVIMLRKALYPFVVLCLLVSPLFAAPVQIHPAADSFDITVLESSPDRTVIEYRINSFELSPIEIEGADYHQVDLGRKAHHLLAGLPELPTLRESILIPDDARMQISILESQFRDYSGIMVEPSKGNLTRNVNPNLVAYHFDDFYGQDAWFPSELAKLDEPYIMRDHRGLVVEMNAFQFNPALETLRVYDRVVVEVKSAGPGLVNVLQERPVRGSAEFQRLYNQHFLNFDSTDRYASVPEVGSMLVIYYDAFEAQIQPLVDWRNQMGIPTEMVPVSSAGSTGSQLKSYVQNSYDANGVCFVLLVGDGPQVPYLTWSGGASDASLSMLAGSDTYPEAFIGRLSAQNATEVQTQVTKTIEYERDAQAGAGWYGKGVGVASAEGSGIGDDGEADWVHMNNIRTDLLGFTYTLVDQIYDPSAHDYEVTNAVNGGRGNINYCGHGSTTAWSTTGFNTTDVNNLSNDNMLPFIQSVACVNGNFPSSTCFAEAWLRATNGGEPSGAVAMYASTINMSWAPPMSGQDEIIDLLADEEKFSYGGLCYNGSCLMMDEYGSSGQTEFKCWTIFGDPALRVRTDTPTVLAVAHADNVDPEAASFTVNTEAGALAALSYGGVFHGSAFADGSGEAVIAIVGDLPEETDVTLTVSAFNKLTHVEAIPTSSPLIPFCEVTPSSLHRVLPPNEVGSDLIHIHNSGAEGSILSYAVEILGFNISWLSCPEDCSGDLPSGQTLDVEVSYNTAGLADGIYHASVSVASNSPSGSVLVPVTLIVSADGTDATELPTRLVLGQNHPNPFNPKTSISFSLPTASSARLEVISINGRRVRMLVNGVVDAGTHVAIWDGKNAEGQDAPSGIYFYRLVTNDTEVTKKMMLLK